MASARAAPRTAESWFCAASTLRPPLIALNAGTASAITSTISPMTISSSVSVKAWLGRRRVMVSSIRDGLLVERVNVVVAGLEVAVRPRRRKERPPRPRQVSQRDAGVDDPAAGYAPERLVALPRQHDAGHAVGADENDRVVPGVENQRRVDGLGV